MVAFVWIYTGRGGRSVSHKPETWLTLRCVIGVESDCAVTNECTLPIQDSTTVETRCRALIQQMLQVGQEMWRFA